VTAPDSLRQFEDVLQQTSQQAPVIAQQLSAIAQGVAQAFTHPLASPPPPPPQTGSTSEAVATGLGGIVLVGLAAWLLSGRTRPSFGATGIGSETKDVLRQLKDPDFIIPESERWERLLSKLNVLGLIEVRSYSDDPLDFEVFLTPRGERLLEEAPATEKPASSKPAPVTERTPVSTHPSSKPKYSLSWENHEV